MRKDTIFSPAFGNRPTYLVGRESILESLSLGLESMPGSKERSTVLLGQRGSGKTVLLWELADRASELGFVVASPTIVSDGMLSRIVEKIQDAGGRYVADSPRVSGGSIGAFGFEVGLEFSREVEESKSAQFKLTQLVRRLSKQGHGVLILIDELQANSQDVRELVAVYQELIGEGLDVALVMAGLPGAVSATLNDKVLTFLNRARKVVLGPLPTMDVEAFYASAFEELRVGASVEQVRRAAEAAQGSPYLMQLVGHGIVLRAEGDSLPDETFDAAVASAQHEFENDVCETTLAALSDGDVRFLHAMMPDAGESSTAVVAERLGVTVDYAQKYRKRLIDAGVIEASGWGRVRICVPLLEGYLRGQR